jgi:ABC-type uncharacterized transport system, permease component
LQNLKKPVQKSESFYMLIAREQKVLREKLTAAISAMKSGDWGAIWKFLVICLLYGMLHALGPGHGKSIVVGYLLRVVVAGGKALLLARALP